MCCGKDDGTWQTGWENGEAACAEAYPVHAAVLPIVAVPAPSRDGAARPDQEQLRRPRGSGSVQLRVVSFCTMTTLAVAEPS